MGRGQAGFGLFSPRQIPVRSWPVWNPGEQCGPQNYVLFPAARVSRRPRCVHFVKYLRIGGPSIAVSGKGMNLRHKLAKAVMVREELSTV